MNKRFEKDNKEMNQPAYIKVAEIIKQEIKEKDLKTGDRIPSERNLAAEFDVSRASVREALRVLENIGLLESQHGTGTFVSNKLERGMYNSFQGLYEMWDISKWELFEFRMAFDVAAVALATRKWQEGEIEELKKAIEKMGQAKDKMDLQEADIEFHKTLIKMTHNTLFIEAFNSLYQLFIEVIYEGAKNVMVSKEEIDQSWYHEPIVVAMEERNIALAELLMKRHYKIVENILYFG